MEDIKLSITLRTGDLFRFTMRHTYCSLSGAFGLLLSLFCLVTGLVTIGQFQGTTTFFLVLVGLLFTVIQPLMLYVKCASQSKKSAQIQAQLDFTLSDDGIHVGQQDQEALVEWGDVRKIVYTKKAIYVYTSPVRAFIFPQDQCSDQFEAVAAMVRAKQKEERKH